MRRLERQWKALRKSETLKYTFNVKSLNIYLNSFLTSFNPLKPSVSIDTTCLNILNLSSVHRVYLHVSYGSHIKQCQFT
jgi:hypothetical protein